MSTKGPIRWSPRQHPRQEPTAHQEKRGDMKVLVLLILLQEGGLMMLIKESQFNYSLMQGERPPVRRADNSMGLGMCCNAQHGTMRCIRRGVIIKIINNCSDTDINQSEAAATQNVGTVETQVQSDQQGYSDWINAT